MPLMNTEAAAGGNFGVLETAVAGALTITETSGRGHGDLLQFRSIRVQSAAHPDRWSSIASGQFQHDLLTRWHGQAPVVLGAVTHHRAVQEPRARDVR